MAKEKKLVIKEADITNNCPECYNQELKLTFYQKHTYGAFYHRTTNEVTHEIKCKKCNSIIYPVNWTPDIERVYDYYNKLVAPDRASVRFTMLSFIILALMLCLVAAAIYFFLQGAI
ncbi:MULTISPECIES: hypothetical protein [Flagellimonas]|uniref:Uncharacterized protein n=1 Tax=Flagellimonas hadalis TaxID=2597517 RepID=A0A5N5IR40_9FLAO|nr:hypothetical protein [Allomuricauda hadalis]KAB5485098.1 hypothetical protein FOT42_015930 [Allomuricauda hadalis]RUA13238.1 MAG: hypothetical protein DSY83_11855 [Flavobacteriia bacterium]